MNHTSAASFGLGVAQNCGNKSRSASEDRISMLAAKADSICGQLDHLADRLGLILSPQGPGGAKIEAEAPPVSCELEGRLIEVDSILRLAITRLESLTERVAI